MNKSNYELIHHSLHRLAIINVDERRTYLLKKEVGLTEVPKETVSVVPVDNVPLVEKLPVPMTPTPTVAYRLSYENLRSLGKTVKELTLKAYSPSTIRTYKGELLVFFQLLGKVPADSLTTDDVKRYLLKCLKDGLKENTSHSRINALKYYYEQVLWREKFFFDIPRPKNA